ncbi:MAG: GNAT family N-acetyltransferase [Minwuia sp.]|nr:GNAT family N-acetyltransferase [Minwuia sp.]
MNANAPMALRPDDWLAGLLGKPAWHLTPSAEPNRPVEVPTGQPCFIDARLPVTRTEVARKLEDAGFRLVDTGMNFERPTWAAAHSRHCRLSVPSDRAAVEDIASRNFTFSRFHLDPIVSNDAANEIKRQWAGNHFAGTRGDGMIVAEVEGETVGFLLYLLSGDVLTIDLVAVDSRHRGKGLARDMIAFADSLVPGVAILRVGTQLANAPSLRSYMGDNFRLISSSYVFHYHG